MLSTRLQFVFLAGVVTLLSAGATAVAYHLKQHELLAVRAAGRLGNVARVFAAGIQHAVDDVLRDTRVLASSVEAVAARGDAIERSDQVRRLLQRQLQTHAELAEIRVVGPPPDSMERLVFSRSNNEVVVLSSAQLQSRGYCPGYRVASALAYNETFVSPVMWETDPFGVRLGPMIRGATGLYAAGEPSGVIAVSLALNPLYEAFSEDWRNERLRFYLADASGMVVFSPQPSEDVGLSEVCPLLGELFPELGDAPRNLDKGGVWHTYTRDGASILLLHRFALYESSSDRYLDLLVAQPVEDALLAPALLGRNGLIAIFVLAMAAIGTSLYLVGRVATPLARLSDRARRIADGDYRSEDDDRRAAKPELTRELAAEMDHMAARLERREEELRTANRRLQRLNLEIDQFTYLAAHDLKAPVRAVSHIASVLQDEFDGQDQGAHRPLLGMMVKQATRMHGFIDGMLLYARAGDDADSVEMVDSGEIVRGIIAAMKLPTGAVIEVETGMPVLVARPVHLREVFRRLLDNAVGHHDRTECAHVRVSAEITKEGFRFAVVDDGPGIPAAYRGQIFRMFHVLDTAREQAGIGLAIASKIVIANGGRIAVLDNTPRGTRMVFDWPRSEVAQNDG